MKGTKKHAGNMKMILRFLKGIRYLFVLSVVLAMVQTALNALTPQIIRYTVDSIIGGSESNLPDWLERLIPKDADVWILLLGAAGMVLVVAVLSGISNYFSRMTLAKGNEGFVKALRDRLFEHIQKLPFSWHVKHQTGDIIQRCTSDVEVIRGFVTQQLMEVFRITFLIILSLSVMFSMNVKISLIAVIFVPVVAGYSGIFYSKIASRFLVADEAEGDLSAAVQENLTGVRVVRAFGREKFEIDRFEEKNQKFSSLWIRLGQLLSVYWGLGDLITGLQILVVIIAGTFEAVAGNITMGDFMAFISYNTTLIWPVRGLGRILSEMSKAGVSADRLGYILNEEEESEPSEALEPDMHGDICFEHVNFSYEGFQPVLKDVDFTIKKGTTFAILGGTGSGKSTLTYLLDRLYDLPEGSGRITIGGVDLNSIRREWVRKNVGLVLQEPFLFSRTIQENISTFRPGAPFEEVQFAARIACVDEAVESFAEGYETIVGERGVTLSGGQKQRVAIARMLMQKAPIMIFDDSLSAVDSETDSKIRASLKECLGSSTVILISHRITTLMQADQILVLDNGRVAELGTHDELLQKNGIYKRIYDIQMSSDDRALLEKEGE